MGQHPNPTQSSLLPSPTPKNYKTLRTTLIVAGVVLVGMCLVSSVFLYQERRAAPVYFWTQFARQGEDALESALEIELVCPNTQAEVFTRRFVRLYRDDVTLFTDNTFELSDNRVRAEGHLRFRGHTFDYEAIYTISTDDAFLVVFGCIEQIEVSPTQPILYWIEEAQKRDLQAALDTDLVCPTSQAEQFTKDFMATLPKGAIIEPQAITEQGDNQFLVTGQWSTEAETADYQAIFTLDDNRPFLMMFNCIAEIEQVSPIVVGVTE